MTAHNIHKIDYNNGSSLKENFYCVKKQTGLSTKNFAYECGMSEASVNTYLTNRFKTGAGARSDIGDRLKKTLDRYFNGGIPASALKIRKEKADLFALYKCGTCKFRMHTQQGCMKFSLTKAEINNGAWVETLYKGSYNLGVKLKCPYAK